MFARISLIGAGLLGSISSLSFQATEVALVLLAGTVVAFGFVRWYYWMDDAPETADAADTRKRRPRRPRIRPRRLGRRA